MGMFDHDKERFERFMFCIVQDVGDSVSQETILGLKLLGVDSVEELQELAHKFDSVGDNEYELLLDAYKRQCYVRDEGDGCPYCQSQDVEMVAMLDNEVQGSCNICKRGWRAFYTMTGIEDDS